MKKLSTKRLALFFTLRVCLKTWYEKGMIDREVTLYNRLSKKFKEIYFFTYGGKEDLNFKNYLNGKIKIITMPSILSGKRFRKIKCLAYSILIPFIQIKLLKKIDFYKTNQLKGGWSALISKILFKKKLIVRSGYIWSVFNAYEEKNKIKNLIISLIEKAIYRKADLVISSSESDYEYINKKYNIKKNHIIIPNYIDLKKFKLLNIKKKCNSICYIGRLEKQKNLEEFFKSLVNSNYCLTVVGNGSLKNKLLNYANENNLNIKYFDFIRNDQIPKILNQHEIFILPSLYEGTPKVLLEAMACGTPVIGTNVEGIKNIIKHDENGLLCETDHESIRHSIDKLASSNSLQHKVSRNARLKIERNYDLNKLIAREIKQYTKLIK